MKVYLVTVDYSSEPSLEIGGIYSNIEKAKVRKKELDEFYNKDYYKALNRIVSEYEKMFGKEEALKRAQQDIVIESIDYVISIDEIQIDEKILTTREELYKK